MNQRIHSLRHEYKEKNLSKFIQTYWCYYLSKFTTRITTKETGLDTKQEYLNQYTTGRDSIFDKVTAEDEEVMEEWE